MYPQYPSVYVLPSALEPLRIASDLGINFALCVLHRHMILAVSQSVTTAGILCAGPEELLGCCGAGEGLLR